MTLLAIFILSRTILALSHGAGAPATPRMVKKGRAHNQAPPSNQVVSLVGTRLSSA
jgi:hypothetical protein